MTRPRSRTTRRERLVGGAGLLEQVPELLLVDVAEVDEHLAELAVAAVGPDPGLGLVLGRGAGLAALGRPACGAGLAGAGLPAAGLPAPAWPGGLAPSPLVGLPGADALGDRRGCQAWPAATSVSSAGSDCSGSGWP